MNSRPVNLEPRLLSLQKANSVDKYGLNINTIKTNRIVLVESVVPNLSADKAGLRKGDKILAVNGEPVDKIEPKKLVETLNSNPEKISFLVDNSESAKIKEANAFSDRPVVPIVEDEFQKQQTAMKTLLAAIDLNSALRSEMRTFEVQKREPFIGYGLNLLEEKTRPYLPSHKLVYPAIEVEDDSPASAAGMQSGLRIVAIDGAFINRELKTIEQVATAIDDSYFKGNSTTFTTIDAVLWANLMNDKPELGSNLKPGQFEVNRDQKSNEYGLSLRTKKIELKHMAFVLPNMPAEKAGIRNGDYILEINGKPVDKFDQQNFLQNVYSSSDKVDLLIVSNQTFAQNLINIEL